MRMRILSARKVSAAVRKTLLFADSSSRFGHWITACAHWLRPHMRSDLGQDMNVRPGGQETCVAKSDNAFLPTFQRSRPERRNAGARHPEPLATRSRTTPSNSSTSKRCSATSRRGDDSPNTPIAASSDEGSTKRSPSAATESAVTPFSATPSDTTRPSLRPPANRSNPPARAQRDLRQQSDALPTPGLHPPTNRPTARPPLLNNQPTTQTRREPRRRLNAQPPTQARERAPTSVCQYKT
jgi:hypothetical protein